MSDNKLLQFKAKVKGEEKEFVFYGEYKETEIKSLMEDKKFPTIEEDVDNLKLMEIKNGKEVPYEVTSRSWAGYEYDETDAFHQTWTSLTMENIQSEYDFSYINPDIQKIADTYKEEQIQLEDGSSVQKYGIYREPDGLVSVAAVTKEEIYFIGDSDELVVDISRESGDVLSDNYFAENSLFELIEDAKEGKEKLLFSAMEYGVPNAQEKKPDKVADTKAVDSRDKAVEKEKTKKPSVLDKLHEKQEKIKGTEKKAPQKKHEQEL